MSGGGGGGGGSIFLIELPQPRLNSPYCCPVVLYGVVWCGVPKALLPKGKRPGCLPTGIGKPKGCVCCARWVLCVSVGPHCSNLLRQLRVLCRWGGSCARPRCGALVALPSGCAPPFGLRAVALWTGRTALPTALRSGLVLQQCCC